MKHFFIVLLFIGCSNVWSQESLEAIRFQKRADKKQVLKTTSNIDSSFIYLYDTLSLPLFDEFSHDKFQTHNANPGDPNVTEELFYRLKDVADVPLPASAAYTATITKLRTVQNGAVIETDLPSTTIKVGSFSSYPVVYTTITVYPPYFIYDTLDFPNDPDTIYIAVPEYAQDSALVFTASLSNPDAYWIDQQAYRNFTHAKDPWSLGVVTFDGLDETGYPYNFGSATVGYADFLTSKSIDLSSFAPNDSIYFSFLAQAEGLGDEPEVSDSLVLEFYNVGEDDWEHVWSMNGSNVQDFKVGHIRITNAAYLTNGFKFRFKNYGGLSGMLDEFHLDYVHLRSGSIYYDTLFKDYAFVYPIGSLIKTYTQVPWDHWVNDPTHMTDSIRVIVRNGSNIPENNLNGSVAVDVAGTNEGNFTLMAQTLSGGFPNYAPRTVYESFHNFSAGYVFSTTPSVEEKTFDVIAAASAQFPTFTGNDTSYVQQYFGNEYAYDDGSAEAAYGVTGVQARIAYQFDPYETDTLLGVKIHFVPSVNDVSDKLFMLTVWADNGGVPGTVLYQDEFFNARQPIYESERGVFTDYYFEDTAVVLPAGKFYVGWRQIDADRLNIGFDKNNDNSDKTFYSLNGGSTWSNSSLEGSMMMRPIFSTVGNADLGLVEPQVDLNWEVYPNPVTDQLSIRWNENSAFPGAVVVDCTGRVLAEMNSDSESISFKEFPSGVYFLKLIGNTPSTKKILK
ncbi:MAG: T9SS type A sorting domain-containing protein [Fluviicola sp.]|nr:T9SS type A sorting domain-containing protein [Fluviicola sp.]